MDSLDEYFSEILEIINNDRSRHILQHFVEILSDLKNVKNSLEATQSNQQIFDVSSADDCDFLDYGNLKNLLNFEDFDHLLNIEGEDMFLNIEEEEVKKEQQNDFFTNLIEEIGEDDEKEESIDSYINDELKNPSKIDISFFLN